MEWTSPKAEKHFIDQSYQDGTYQGLAADIVWTRLYAHGLGTILRNTTLSYSPNAINIPYWLTRYKRTAL